MNRFAILLALPLSACAPTVISTPDRRTPRRLWRSGWMGHQATT